MNLALLEAVLPADLLLYFDITGFKEEHDKKENQKILVIDLTEKNEIRVAGCSFENYETKDIFPAKRVQDFPLREALIGEDGATNRKRIR